MSIVGYKRYKYDVAMLLFTLQRISRTRGYTTWITNAVVRQQVPGEFLWKPLDESLKPTKIPRYNRSKQSKDIHHDIVSWRQHNAQGHRLGGAPFVEN
ncbi:hypothetical protein ACFL5Z_03950 [Planctomycetota bacterium]